MTVLTLAAGMAAIHVAATWLQAVRRAFQARREPRLGVPERSEWPLVSVIVPAWTEATTIERCLRSLSTVEYGQWEVIVAAGGGDGTYDLAVQASRQLPNGHVIEQQPRGKNAALSQGLLLASGEVIVTLDADSEVSPDWLKRLVAPMAGAVVATTGWPFPHRTTALSRVEQMEYVEARLIRRSVILNGSGSIAILRAALERIGGFPEDVLVGVDWDLDARLTAAGLQRAFARGAMVRTERPATIAEYWFNEVRWRRAHFASILRQLRWPSAPRLRLAASTYLYLVAWLMLALTALLAISSVVDPPGLGAATLGLWSIVVAWLALRRLALPLGVATYTRDTSYLKLAWLPPVLLGITLAAIIPATLSPGKASPHFKGSRPAGSVTDAG